MFLFECFIRSWPTFVKIPVNIRHAPPEIYRVFIRASQGKIITAFHHLGENNSHVFTVMMWKRKEDVQIVGNSTKPTVTRLSTRDLTQAGDSMVLTLPCPSWPCLLSPNVYKFPDSMSTELWVGPRHMSTTLWRARTFRAVGVVRPSTCTWGKGKQQNKFWRMNSLTKSSFDIFTGKPLKKWKICAALP